MLDASVAYNRYKFLGHEFLTWVWFMIENYPDSLPHEDGQPVSLRIGNRIILENSRKEALETVSIKANQSELEEGRLSLKKGAVVTEMNLFFRFNHLLWTFDIKGESLAVSGVKVPETQSEDPCDGLETTLLTKMEKYEILVSFLHNLYKQFVKHRISSQWEAETVPAIKRWISAA